MTTPYVTMRIVPALALSASILAACGDPASGRQAEERPPAAAARAQRQAPRDTVRLDDVGYDRGAPDAPILVIEFSDFGCPYCRQFALETYPALHRDFVETGRVRWKYVPFALGIFPNGAEAARAAECAAEQGEERFWAMHDLLYERQREWKSTGEPDALFGRLAAELRLDGRRFASCYREDRRAARTRIANQLAAYANVRATPTFFANGQRIEGALPLEQFRAVLERMLPR